MVEQLSLFVEGLTYSPAERPARTSASQASVAECRREVVRDQVSPLSSCGSLKDFNSVMFCGRTSQVSSVTNPSLRSSPRLLNAGIVLPTDITVSIPGIDYANLALVWGSIPVGILMFLLVGLCASVMWGGIFNLATEGLGKYTAVASGVFMTMVFGFAVMVGIQGLVADITGSYLASFFVPLACAAYILFFALVGSKNVNTDIPVE